MTNAWASRGFRRAATIGIPRVATTMPRPPAPGRLRSLPAFLGKLADSGLLTAEEIAAEQAAAPAAARHDVDAFAAYLLETGRLTAYQANELVHGRANGFVLGNYVIQKSLGEGGMGKVFLARHRRMKREVALKVLPPARARDPEAARRFACEVEAIARLHHPNIAAAFDADEAKGVQFLALEFVAGHDLAREIKARGKLPVVEAAACMAQVARGLAYAHRQGVIHRDVKPHNLMRTADGVVKILDMGLARLAEAVESRGGAEGDANGRGHGATLAGRVVGTPDYISPEQAAGEPVDARADLYSMGCTLFHLVAGRPPFMQETLHGKLLAHALDPTPVLAAAAPDVPPALSALCQRLMAKEAADRPPDADQVADELEAIARAAQAAIPPRPPGGGPANLAPRRPPTELDEFGRMMREEQLLQPTVKTGSSSSLMGAPGGGLRGAMPYFSAAAVVAVALLALSRFGNPAPTPVPPRSTPAVKSAPARERLAAALRELAKANPGFGSVLDPDSPPPHEADFDGEVLARLHLPTDALRDLRALAGLPSVRRLELTPTAGRRGALADLAPLAGLPLRELALADNPDVRSIAALRGLPLVELDLSGTSVAELEPLVGMPLRKLELTGSSVHELAPLAGVRTLRDLRISVAPVTNLAPLAALELEHFEARDFAAASLAPVLKPSLKRLEIAVPRLLADADLLRASNVEELKAAIPPGQRLAVHAVARGMPRLRTLNGNLARR